MSDKKSIVETFQQKSGDTGSPGVQIALLTHRIRHLSAHFKTHKKDFHSRRGLIRLVSKRKKLLAYLRAKNFQAYADLVKKLELRK